MNVIENLKKFPKITLEQEADLIPFTMEVSLKHSKILAYLQPLIIDNTIFLQPFPSTETRISTPIKPFAAQVVSFNHRTSKY